MKKYDGILLCSDLDGTLSNSDGKISNENLEAIDYFCKNGGHFTLCTGRNPEFAKKLTEAGLNINAPLTALNGAMIYSFEKEEILYENPIDKSQLFDVPAFVEANKSYINIAFFHSFESYNDFSEIGDKKLYKMVFVSDSPESSAMLRKNLEKASNGKHFITNSWNTGLEILDKKSTKGECIKLIRRLVPFEVTKTVCVGDYENDISMLKEADLSYAVGNALPCVKESADKITVTNNEIALARIISELHA